MADSSVPITAGSGTNIDTRTESINSDHRQVVVLGDPVSGNAVASVQATDPTSNTEGIVVRDVNTSAIVASLGGTIGVYLNSTAGTINVQLKPGTIAVSLDPGHLLGSVTSNAGTGTMTVAFDPGHELGSIKGSNSSIAVFFDRGNPTVTSNAGTGTFNVQFDPGHELGSIKGINTTVAVFFSPASPAVSATFSAASIEVVPTTGSRKTTDDAAAAQRVLIVGSQTNASLAISSIATTVAVFFSPANPSVNATFNATSLEVVPTTGSRKTMDDASAAQRVLIVGSQTAASLTINGTVTANAGSGTMTIQFDPGHTLGSVLVNPGTGTLNVQLDPGHTLGFIAGTKTTLAVGFDPGYTIGKVDQGNATTSGTQAWLANIQSTASIFTASGTATGISTLGNTIISPSANASFKIYAFSLQTTGQVSIVARFTNGAGSGPTEFWRPLITASGVTGAQGANLATYPGAPLFVTGVSTTLALLLDSATLVHYSVSYTKESA